MGVADLVPGVSGGTVALITGIYGELLESIKSIDGNALKTLRRDGISAAWCAINGSWLTTLLAGMLTSAVLLAGLIDYLLNAYGLQLWSFFSGVIGASAVLLLRRYRPTYWHHWFLLIFGVHAALALSTLPPTLTRSRSGADECVGPAPLPVTAPSNERSPAPPAPPPTRTPTPPAPAP